MNHLDEGTIHAWLDGATDATQALEIETHIAECAVCSAAVAEARGFVAGASRILSALDDVPAGVLPVRASAPAGVVSARPSRRQWRAASWVSGIAAVLVGAVVLGTVDMPMRSVDVLERPVAGAGLDSQSSSLTLPGMEAAPPTTAVAERAEPQVARPVPSAPVPAPAQRAAVADAAAGIGGAESRGDVRDAARDAAARGAVPGEQLLDTGLLAGARERAAAAPIAEQRMLSLEMGVPAAARTDGYAGCYKIESADERGRMPALGEVARRAVGRAAQAPVAAAPSARMDYTAPPPPAAVRLDTTAAALGFAVRLPGTDSVIGSWRALRDSARVDLLARGVFTFARTQRVPCSEP